MRKKQFLILSCALISGTVLMSGCSKKQSETETQTVVQTETLPASETETETEPGSQASDDGSTSDEPILDASVAGWHMVVEDMLINRSLENVSVELGYTGVETSEYSKEASEGNTFCLVKLLIEKENSTEVIDWKELKLIDADGTEYQRIEDEFLIDLGMMRMPGTTLNFGSNEGWIAFEIKEGAKGLTLSYPFAEESFQCTFS